MLLSYSLNAVEDLANRLVLKWQQFGFKANVDKFQLFSNILIDNIIIHNTNISSQKFVKYLGMYIGANGIDYDKDLKHKEHKGKHVISIIKWTTYHKQFKSAFESFYKSCVMPVITYGLELYSPDNLTKLEIIRIGLLKNLHSGKYRFMKSNMNTLI